MKFEKFKLILLVILGGFLFNPSRLAFGQNKSQGFFTDDFVSRGYRQEVSESSKVKPELDKNEPLTEDSAEARYLTPRVPDISGIMNKLQKELNTEVPKQKIPKQKAPELKSIEINSVENLPNKLENRKVMKSDPKSAQINKNLRSHIDLGSSALKPSNDHQPVEISLVIKVKRKEQLFSRMEEMFRASKKFGLKIGNIYLLSDLKPHLSESQLMGDSQFVSILNKAPNISTNVRNSPLGFHVWQVNLNWLNSPPSRYQGQEFPLWIIRAKGKEHLVPGTTKLSTLFNFDGNFIDLNPL